MFKKAVMMVSAAIFWFSLYIYIPYLTPELMAIGVGASMSGIIVALHSLAQMGMRVPLGLNSGRRGRHKQMVVAGMLLSAAAAFIMYFWPTPWMFAIGNAVSGFSSATYVGITVLYARYFAPSETDKAMGLISAMSNVGILCAFILGGFLWDRGGIHEICLVAGIGALVGFVASLFIKDVQMPPTKNVLADMKAVLRSRELISSSVLCLLVKLVVFGTAFAFTPKLAQEIGATGAQLSAVNGLFIGASVLGSYFVTTKAGKRVGSYPMAVASFLFLTVYSIAVPLVRQVPLMMAVSFIGGLGYSTLTTIFMANAVHDLPLEHKSAGMGVYQAMYSLGSALGPIVVGFFIEYTNKVAAYMIVGMVAIAALVMTMRAHTKDLLQ